MDLYFNGAVDADWNTLGNWWTDSAHTNPAGAIPTNTDAAHVNADVTSDSGAGAVCQNLFLGDQSGVTNFSITVTVTNDFTIYAASSSTASASCTNFIVSGINAGSVAASTLATINSGGDNQGSITGAFLILIGGFNGSANPGTIIGSGTVNNGGENSLNGTLQGTVALDGANYGSIAGNATLGSTGDNFGSVSGVLTAVGVRNGNGTVGTPNNGALGTYGTLNLTGVSGGAALGGLLP